MSVLGIIVAVSAAAVLSGLAVEGLELKSGAVAVVASSEASAVVVSSYNDALASLDMNKVREYEITPESLVIAEASIDEIAGTIEKEVIVVDEYTEEEVQIYISNLEKNAQEEAYNKY